MGTGSFTANDMKSTSRYTDFLSLVLWVVGQSRLPKKLKGKRPATQPPGPSAKKIAGVKKKSTLDMTDEEWQAWLLDYDESMKRRIGERIAGAKDAKKTKSNLASIARRKRKKWEA